MKRKAAVILGIILAATAGVAVGSGAMPTAVTAASRVSTTDAGTEDTSGKDKTDAPVSDDTADSDADTDKDSDSTEESTQSVTAAALESGDSVISVTGSNSQG